MASLADKAILSGADNRPPMLEKDMYDSWKSRMELYMLNHPHGRMILESVEQYEQVESDTVDVISNIASSDVKTFESKRESVDVENKGVYRTIETKHVRKNNFSPPINEDWNSDDESEGNPQKKEYKEKGVIDSGCLRHMIGNKCYLTDYEDYDGGFVLFGDGKGRIYNKGKIKTGTLDFDDVYFCKELKCDNGTEFKNSVMNRFYDMKGIKREFSIARTPQQNGVAERKNITLIEAARTMIVDSKLLTTFWAKVINTACYVLNRALVIKPHNKIPYKLIRGGPPLTDFMKPFGCLVTILNTKDSLGKFDGKADEGFFVGSPVSTAGPSFANIASPSPINDAGTPASIEEEVNMNNVVSSYTIPYAPLPEFLKDHPKDQVIGSIETPVQTRQMTKINEKHVYQMDVKSAFLYGKIEEQVYVCQPPGFEDPDFNDKVYKIEKALDGLHQAPRA
nr:ribonuclease H-like domain-containing protein [Tanacetum cinerariifolium]